MVKILALTIVLLVFVNLSQPAISFSAAAPPMPTNSSPKEPCPNNKCDTAIGSIDVSNPMSVIMRIFSIVLAIGAAGAVALIIFAGYRILVSRGNKEALQGARETITSAVVGLLFIVFSLVILSVIAGDILKIPGFK